MDTCIVVTNNTDLTPDRFDNVVLQKVPGGPEAVYAALEQLLQAGHRLISSPLPVNVPLIRSYVRSVIIQKSESPLDAEGLRMVQAAARRTSALGVNREERVRPDLEMIDTDQLAHALRDLRALDQQ